MRSRLLTAVAAATVLVAACSGDDDDSTADTSSAATTVDASTSTGDTVTDVTLVPATPPPSVPDVSLPGSIPTELVVTELRPGEGEGAVDGQFVVVDYVGVRSEDGAQFDASYGRAPFPIRLGDEQVIAGWELGLLGAKAGQRLQLDIPAELAYGDTPRGDVIQAGDALTFVIDVRSVVPGDAPEPSDLPTSPEPVSEATSEEVRAGTGPALAAGDTGLFHIIALQHGDGSLLSSTWEGQPQSLPIDDAQLLPGLSDLLVGMQVGARRVVVLPADPEAGITTDVVLAMDLLAIT